MKPEGDLLGGYFSALESAFNQVIATDSQGDVLPLNAAISWTINMLNNMKSLGGKAIFIGNGGSAAIASHMAIDYCKNGGFPGLAFNDAAALTCLANDLGYEQAFAHQISNLGKSEDILIAISSSGASANIIAAAETASSINMKLITLSGFKENNSLRERGHMNFFVPITEYGIVEITHLVLCHAILDISMGWRPEADG